MDWIKLSLIFVLMSSVLLAQNLDDIYQKIVDTYQKTSTFEGEFIQENFYSELDILKDSKGKIYFDEVFFMLEYIEPSGQVLLLKDKELKIFDSNENQLIITSLNTVIKSLNPIDILSYYWQNSDKEMRDGKLIIKPIKEDDIKLLHIEFNDDFLINKIKYYDQNENFVSYEFLKIKTNIKFKSDQFNLNIPDDVFIIER